MGDSRRGHGGPGAPGARRAGGGRAVRGRPGRNRPPTHRHGGAEAATRHWAGHLVPHVVGDVKVQRATAPLEAAHLLVRLFHHAASWLSWTMEDDVRLIRTLDVELLPPTDPPLGDSCDSAIAVDLESTTAGTLVNPEDDHAVPCGYYYRDTVYRSPLPGRVRPRAGGAEKPGKDRAAFR